MGDSARETLDLFYLFILIIYLFTVGFGLYLDIDPRLLMNMLCCVQIEGSQILKIIKVQQHKSKSNVANEIVLPWFCNHFQEPTAPNLVLNGHAVVGLKRDYINLGNE